MIENSEIFFLKCFLGIRSLSGDIVVVLPPCTHILETLRLSPINLLFLIIIYFGCCSLAFLSSKLADEIDLVLVSGITVSSVSVLEEDPYLFNEVNLFNSKSLSESLVIGFLFFVCVASCWSVFKLPIMSFTVFPVAVINGILEYMILCLDIF